MRYTLTTINTGDAAGQDLRVASTCAWWTASERSAAASTRCRACCASGCKQVPGITVTHVGLLDAVGGNKQIEFSLQGPDLKELERLTARW